MFNLRFICFIYTIKWDAFKIKGLNKKFHIRYIFLKEVITSS